MNLGRRHWAAAGLGVLALTALSACEVAGVGVDGTVEVGYVGGYYEPYGYEYGGWGPGYRVGPYRAGARRIDHPSRPFRAAPPSRPMPSIPGRRRGR